MRKGELTSTRVTDDFVSATAHIGVVRADWHVVKNWDFLAEQKWLWDDQSDGTRSGSLLVLYRHLGDNFKAGVGYNFADFSDRLTYLDFDDKGMFLNLVAKF